MAEAVRVELVMLLVFILCGVTLQFAERLWPIRRFPLAPETRLNWTSLGLARVYGKAFGGVGKWLVALPLIAWAGGVHKVLETCPPVVGLIAAYLTYDFCVYWVHRLQHSRLLWSTHAFHHSARTLNWLAATRESPVHHLLIGVPAAVATLVAPLSGPAVWVGLLYASCHDSFIHSNVRIKSRLFNWVFITGEHHFIHHATDLRLGNSNFGFVFTFWDRLFGTYVAPESAPADFPLGLGYEVSTARLIVGLPPAAPAPTPETISA